MPDPDPIPSPRHSTMRRFWRIFRLLALLSIIIAAIAVVLVARGDPTVHVHMNRLRIHLLSPNSPETMIQCILSVNPLLCGKKRNRH